MLGDEATLGRAIDYLSAALTDVLYSDVVREYNRESMRAWRAKNRERSRDIQRNYRARDPERDRERVRRYRADDPTGKKALRAVENRRRHRHERASRPSPGQTSFFEDAS
jgi:hypothetical protein